MSIKIRTVLSPPQTPTLEPGPLVEAAKVTIHYISSSNTFCIDSNILICIYNLSNYMLKWKRTMKTVGHFIFTHKSTLFLQWLQNIPSYSCTLSSSIKMAPRNIAEKQKMVFSLLQPSIPNPLCSIQLPQILHPDWSSSTYPLLPKCLLPKG